MEEIKRYDLPPESEGESEAEELKKEAESENLQSQEPKDEGLVQEFTPKKTDDETENSPSEDEIGSESEDKEDFESGSEAEDAEDLGTEPEVSDMAFDKVAEAIHEEAEEDSDEEEAEDTLDQKTGMEDQGTLSDEISSKEDEKASTEGQGDDAMSTKRIPPVDDDGAPEIVTEISMDEMEKKITDSTVVSASNSMDDEYDGDDEKVPRFKKRPVKLTIFLLLLLVGVFVTVYIFVSVYFQSHFYSGTKVDGIDVSGYTVDEVKEAIQQQVENYTLVISAKDGETATLTADEINLNYKDDKKVDELMSNQDAWQWFMSLGRNKSYEISAGTTYDRDKAEEIIRSYSFMDEDNMTAPEDAYIASTDSGASVVSEVEGNTIDVDKAIEAILKAVKNGASTIDLTSDPDCYEHPKVKADDDSMKSKLEEWNAYLAINLTYSFGDNKETISGTDIGPHLKDDGDKITLDTSWVRELVGTWADKYNTFGRERQFTTHSGTVVTLPAYTLHTGETDPKTGEELEHTSDYGWLLDSDATTEDIISALNDKTSGDRDPIFKYSALGWDNGDLTGNYVEVSLTEQHLWVYHDGQVVVDTDVVTGYPSADRKTYPGCFAVDAKKSPATLGTVATQGYSSEVQYWLPFDGGRGLHDAPWRSTFGGSEYVSNGSHGCVNCPADVMETIYKYVEIGMAVCVY